MELLIVVALGALLLARLAITYILDSSDQKELKNVDGNRNY
jgi:Tfp pilus assembly protein FimT